jgi:hypothetical protein
MKNKPDLQPTPTTRRENFKLIQLLAHSRFIQLHIGTEADFKKLWREAFVQSATAPDEHFALRK